MPKIDNKAFYATAIQKYGITPKGVNWHSKESQKKRFDIILELLPDDMSGYSVADAGCGFGDLYLYMAKKDKTPKEYIGIDSLEDMYAIASNNTGCEIVLADVCKDILPNADFYICSGAMNVLESFEAELFIYNCYKSCNYAFVFNVLCGEVDSRTYNYMTKEHLKYLASKFGVLHTVFRDEYMDGDISAVFYKKRDF